MKILISEKLVASYFSYRIIQKYCTLTFFMGVNVQQIYYNYKVSYVQKKWRSVHMLATNEWLY